jgi:hypothetical protein
MLRASGRKHRTLRTGRQLHEARSACAPASLSWAGALCGGPSYPSGLSHLEFRLVLVRCLRTGRTVTGCLDPDRGTSRFKRFVVHSQLIGVP